MHYVSRTQTALASFTRQAMVGERWAAGPYFLQSLDARVKLLILAAVLVTISLIHRPAGLALMAGAALALALASHLGGRGLRHPIWWAGPALALFIALPAAFSLITPGEPLITFIPRPLLAITVPGAEVAGRLVLRVTASVWWVGALLLSSRWERVLAALRALGVPAIFLFALAMAQRYLFLFVRLNERVLYARRSRALQPVDAATERSLIGVNVANLFRRTAALAAEVHAAMVARGFVGEYRTLTRFRLQSRDLVWAALTLGWCAALWWMNRLGGG